MKRGPATNRGLRAAIPAALALGRVMLFVASAYYPCDFMIAGDGYLGIIRVRLSEKIRAEIDEIQRTYSHSIADLAPVPRGGPVSCELWLYSRYGTLRFFRITGDGIEEIDRSSILCKRKSAGDPGTGSSPGSGTATPDPVPLAPAGKVPGTAAPNGPIIRWLKKRNAMILAAGGTNVLDPYILDLLTGTKKPVAGINGLAGGRISCRKAGVTGPGKPGSPEPSLPADGGPPSPTVTREGI